MIDFEARLTTLLDDVATSIDPHPDPDSVFRHTVTALPNDVRRFRPSFAAVAAAGVVLVGGSAFAMERLTSDSPNRVTPAATPVTATPVTGAIDEPTTTAIDPTTTTIAEVVTTPAKESVYRPVMVSEPNVPRTEPTVPPTVPSNVPTVPPTEPTEPTEPTVPPATIEFTANLGPDGQANTPMTQGFYGTAQPGTAIRIASDWGVAETVAGPNGNWDATLVMPEVPAGTTVAVRITSSTTETVREFTLHRPGEPTPPFVAFTAKAALTTTDHTPPVNEYSGTSTAGAVISITSDYGSTQVESNADGKWSARVEFPDAPLDVTFNVHITSSKGEAVYDFPLTRVGPG